MAKVIVFCIASILCLVFVRKSDPIKTDIYEMLAGLFCGVAICMLLIMIFDV